MRWQRPFRAHDRYVQYIQYIETLYVLEPYGMEGGDGGNRFRLVVTGKSWFPFLAGRGLVFGPGEWTGTCRGLPRAGMGPGSLREVGRRASGARSGGPQGARKGLPGTAGAEERHKKHAFARGWDITGQKRVFYRVL